MNLPQIKHLAFPGSGLGSFLLASVLVHAAVVLLPYLGQRAEAVPRKVTGAPEPAHVFRATLAGLTPIVAVIDPIPSAAAAQGPSKASDPPGVETQPEAESRVGAALLPIPGQTFYPTADLSKKPQPTTPIELDPPESQMIVASGKIVLKIWINDSGEVVDVQAEKSDLPGAVVAAAVAAFRHYRFTPGEREGRRVPSVMRIEVSYEDFRLPPR